MGESKEFVELRVYLLAEKLADRIWEIVLKWEYFARDTVGKQLVKAADSVGANIAEGSGRKSFQDNRRFVRIARGSLNETRHWLRRAKNRSLLKNSDAETLRKMLFDLQPLLSAYHKSIGTTRTKD